MKAINEGVGEARRGETGKTRVFNGVKYLWLKNPGKLTDKQQGQLKVLRGRYSKPAWTYPDQAHPARVIWAALSGGWREVSPPVGLPGSTLPVKVGDWGHSDDQAPLGESAGFL